MNYEIPFHPGSISDSTFLVTGGAGFIGSHIVEYLLAQGVGKVRILDNLATGRMSNIEAFLEDPRAELVEGDIRDAAICAKACEGIDFVSHQAAMGSVPRSIKDPITTNDVNLGGFVNVITAAKNAGVKRIVYASSSSVYGDAPQLPKYEENVGSPLSPYAVSKKGNELYAAVFRVSYDLEIVGLRYFNIFGPRQDPNGPYAAVIPRFLDRLMRGETVFIDGDGEQSRDFTFVENAVQANIRALTMSKPEAFGEVHNIAFGERFTINQLYQSLAEAVGSDKAAEHRDPRAGDVRHSLASIEKASANFGYAPRLSMAEGLKITVDYFKQETAAGRPI